MYCYTTEVRAISSICGCKYHDVYVLKHSCKLKCLDFRNIETMFFTKEKENVALLRDIIIVFSKALLYPLSFDYVSEIDILEKVNGVCLSPMNEIVSDYLTWY